MAVAKSFTYRHTEMKKLKLFEGQAILDNKCNDIASFEGLMDNFSFECVWQEPKEKQMINQFLEDEVDFFDETRGRCTPDLSELMSALSTSFPSGSLQEVEVVDAKPCYKEPSTSTPIRPVSGESQKMEFSEFDDASPIVSSSVNPQVIMLRRCRLKLEDDEEFVGDCKLKLKNL